jgi:Icc-related predicted phosphoesterase
VKILAIADDDTLLCQRPTCPVDVLISCGDLHDEAIKRAITHYRPRKVLAVRGNHDTDAAFPSGVIDLHCSLVTFEGVRFGGFCGSWRYKAKGHHLYEQSEVSAMMRAFPKVDVFITHNSPARIHERDEHVHQGFEAFIPYLDKAEPRLMIHGHQHLDIFTIRGATTILGVFGETIIHLEAAAS